jgi:hypothetical protein
LTFSLSLGVLATARVLVLAPDKKVPISIAVFRVLFVLKGELRLYRVGCDERVTIAERRDDHRVRRLLYGYESDFHDTSMVDASTHSWNVTYVGRPE